MVVDETFATRDLVRAWLRSPSYLAVVLADPGARFFVGQGRLLREVADRWFPVMGDRPDGRSERGRRHDPGIEREQRRVRLNREIDLGLDEYVNAATGPLFVLGARERAAAFLAASRHQRRIAGVVSRGLPSGEHVGEVARSVWPAVEDWLERRQEEAISEVEAAMERAAWPPGSTRSGHWPGMVGANSWWWRRATRSWPRPMVTVSSGWRTPGRLAWSMTSWTRSSRRS